MLIIYTNMLKIPVFLCQFQQITQILHIKVYLQVFGSSIAYVKK